MNMYKSASNGYINRKIVTTIPISLWEIGAHQSEGSILLYLIVFYHSLHVAIRSPFVSVFNLLSLFMVFYWCNQTYKTLTTLDSNRWCLNVRWCEWYKEDIPPSVTAVWSHDYNRWNWCPANIKKKNNNNTNKWPISNST